MRYSLLYLLLMYCGMLNSQVTVTTITPEIEGSGGLSLDAEGNLYIADFGDFLGIPDPDGLPNHILKLDPNLMLTQYATGFTGASGNAFDANEILYQSDIRDHAIYKITNGMNTLVTTTGIIAPVGLTFDSQGNLFICNCGSNTIRKVTPQGVSSLFASGSLFNCPNGITIDAADNLYVSNFSNGDILMITPAGDVSVLNSTPGGTTGGPSNGHLDYHQPSNTLFIASHGSNKIYYLNLNDPSNLQVLAGSGIRGNDDGPALQATFSRPNGVAVSATGDSIYVNSAVPVTNIPNNPLNPQLIRLITGVSAILKTPASETVTNISVTPNPTTDTVLIRATLLEMPTASLSYTIRDLEGRIILKGEDISPVDLEISLELDLSSYPSGLYFFSLKAGHRRIQSCKIIKE